MLVTPKDFISLLIPEAAARSVVFMFRGAELMVREADGGLPDPDVWAAFGGLKQREIPVGRLGAMYCATTWVSQDAAPMAGYRFTGLRRLFGVMDEALLAVAGRAFQIAEWARTHQYCGACGGATAQAANERCLRCVACGHAAYPRISPAMMVLVTRGDQILLARHAAAPAARYTALAGFVEVGESIEDAIHREVFEEVGLYVARPRYFGSQAWPFPHSLMIAFTAEYAGGELVLDRNEISDAQWVGPDDEMPELPPAASIARALIDAHLPRTR